MSAVAQALVDAVIYLMQQLKQETIKKKKIASTELQRIEKQILELMQWLENYGKQSAALKRILLFALQRTSSIVVVETREEEEQQIVTKVPEEEEEEEEYEDASDDDEEEEEVDADGDTIMTSIKKNNKPATPVIHSTLPATTTSSAAPPNLLDLFFLLNQHLTVSVQAQLYNMLVNWLSDMELKLAIARAFAKNYKECMIPICNQPKEKTNLSSLCTLIHHVLY